MADNRLRCVLAHRLDLNGLDGGTGVVTLAKYDHAGQYETHAGADSALYGGRDKSYADAVALVIGKDPPTGASAGGGIGGFKMVQSDVHQVVYGADSDGLCLAVITGQKYPTRVSISMLSELYDKFSKQFGDAAKTGGPNSLSKKAKSTFVASCEKYSDLKQIDKASALLDKVEAVKGTMQGNIATMLENTEKADVIAQQSDQLNEQASVFKKKSTNLRKQMRCKNMKMTIILSLLIVGILIVILVPLILRARKAVKDD